MLFYIEKVIIKLQINIKMHSSLQTNKVEVSNEFSNLLVTLKNILH